MKLNTIFRPSSLGEIPDVQSRAEKNWENSTPLKIAACLPVLGLFICQMTSNSLGKKLKELPLPEEFRPHPLLGNILNKNATPEERKAACERAAQLNSINRDYTKAALVNSILTIALAVYALALDVIPFILGGFLIGSFSTTAAVFAFVLYYDSKINLYQEMGEARV